MDYAKKLNPGVPKEKRLNRTLQAWANVLVMAEAMKRADKAGALTGESIRAKGFETLANWQSPLGGTAPLTFTTKDHRPQTAVNIYQVQKGKMVLLDRPDMKSRWPKEWESSWHGW